MGKHASQDRRERLPPAAGAAAAATTASAAMACVVIALWAALPDERAWQAVLAITLLLMPLGVGVATWISAHRGFRACLEPAIDSIERIAAHDFATPTALATTTETARLAMAIERCRLVLVEQQRPAKMHAAVARVMGMAISRIAEGVFSARITVELPPPYQSFRDDFNAAMEALQAPMHEGGERLREQAREIIEAAEQLRRRAVKLAERIDADLAMIGAAQTAPEEAASAASHTLEGAGVAARRNIEAADHFAKLGRLLQAEAERQAGGEPAVDANTSRPAAEVPLAIGATALKLVDGNGR